MALKIGVLKERVAGETRVALVPEVAKRLAKLGVAIVAERDAGSAAGFPDTDYADVEFGDAARVLAEADVLLTVQPPTPAQCADLKRGAVTLGFLAPHRQIETIAAMKDAGLTSFAMELVPRISRAQSMDALSSQASVAGYKAVLIAADRLDKFFPMLTTAAGTIRPAQVLVVGAGVAGLQAIATARRLGAIVEAYDVRSATKEQVKSLGAKFVETGVSAEGAGGYARELTEEEKAQQQEALEARIAVADAVITTAAIPGRPAPRIIPRAAVERMRPGAVIVDIAAETGGNCELTVAGETVEHDGVRIVGPVNLAAQLPRHASEMYAKNLFNFLTPAIKEGALGIDWDDEVFAESVVTHEGEIRNQAIRDLLQGAAGENQK